MKKYTILLLGLFTGAFVMAQDSIPAVYNNIYYDQNNKLYHQYYDKKYYTLIDTTALTLSNMQGNPQASVTGLDFDFNNLNLSGTLYYGLINYKDSKHPSPVWYKVTSNIDKGKATIDILRRLSGRYDMTSWKELGAGTLGYRIANEKGELLYDGIIGFKYNELHGFSVATTITEGPFINLLESEGVTISFDTNLPVKANITVDEKVYESPDKRTHHEIRISDLQPATNYAYKVNYEDGIQNYSFKTAPKPGSRKPFVFAYTSDSRAGQGGGEHDLYGANFYVMRKISALAKFKEVAFMQFTGDMINCYSTIKDEINLQYANWKRSIEPFAHYFPINVGIGNHEVIGKLFTDNEGRWVAFIPGFPFITESPSAIFASNFVNPINDLKSEDGAYYDPDPSKIDFPPYDETVFYYTYDNVAMIVLSSDYFYTPSIKNNPTTGGNLHAYLMDNQMQWLEKTLQQLENNKDIDHVFVTQHTPAFPNGGHVSDDMWYNGDNSVRPTIAGKPVEKGIIERRDEYLDLLINKSTKVIGIMTGDEHNYNKVKITPEVNIYPDNYILPKLKRNRTLWQINNGSAGAPYYAQNHNTPWVDAVSGFTTQQALVLIYVDGLKVSAKVMNPDTLEMIDEYILRE